MPTLAFGIGANTAIFSVINDILLCDLRYAEPERLAMVWEKYAKRNREMNVVSPAKFLDWRDQSYSFTGLAGFYDRRFTLTGDGNPVEVMAAGATPKLFTLLGAQPQLGRRLRALILPLYFLRFSRRCCHRSSGGCEGT